MLFLEKEPDPDIGGELVLGYPDALAVQVFRVVDSPVRSHVDRSMPERPRRKNWHGDIGRRARSHLDRIAAERQFADVVIGVPKRAKEDLLRFLQHEDRIYAVDLNIPIDERTHTVIVANGDRQPELVISHYLFSLLRNDINESVNTWQPGEPGDRLDTNQFILSSRILPSTTF